MPSGLQNTPYTAIAGNSSGGSNTVAPYNLLLNDTKITTLDSTEKGLLIHTSKNGLGSINANLWEIADIANYDVAPPFADDLGNATGGKSLPQFLVEDTFKGIRANMGRFSRSPGRSFKVTLVWTGTPSITDTDANLDVYLRGTTTGRIYTASNARWFGGSSFVGTDAVAGGAGVDLITGAGAIEYIEQIYLPSWSVSPWDTS
ncbi:MAG: hypothetical protein ACKPH9_11160, partial [Dolichospermum sp.]